MFTVLPAPEIVRSFGDDSFTPPLPALALRWPADVEERLWELPEGVSISGPPPRRLGIVIRRTARDTYQVRLLWDQTGLTWHALTRAQVLSSAVPILLAALGASASHLLDQPVRSETCLPQQAA